MKQVRLRENVKGVPASLRVGAVAFQRGKWFTVSDDDADELLRQTLNNGDAMFEGKDVVVAAGDTRSNISKLTVPKPVPAKTSVHRTPPPTMEDRLGPKVQPVPFVPRKRREFSLLFRGPMVAGNSISQVMRNLTVASWQNGVDSHCTEIDTLPEYQTFLAAIDHLATKPTGPYVTVAWDPTVKNWSREEGYRCHIDPSDSFRYVHQNVVDQYASDDVAILFTLSKMCNERWVAAGVPEEKVVVLPLGVDTAVFNPTGRRYDINSVKWTGEPIDDDTFIFMLSGYLQHRKGVPEALEAYLTEFSAKDNVALLIKNCSGAAWGRDVRPIVQKLTAARGDGAPRVGYLDARLSDWDFAALLRRADCLLNTHHMEGFGLIPLEAMACGTLTVVTDYHGPTTYANAANSILIPVCGEIESKEQGVPPGVMWADYKLSDVGAAMRKAYTGDNSKLIKQGLQTAQEFSWAQSAEVVAQAIEEKFAPLKYRPTKWIKTGLDLSIVAPVRGQLPLLRRMLETLYTVAHPLSTFETVIFDDANSEEDRDFLYELKKDYPIRIVGSTVNRGCHGGRQILFEEAQGEFIFSIDGDLDFRATQSGWDKVLIEEICRGSRFSLVHPLLLSWPNGDGEIRVQSAGGYTPEDKPCPQAHRFAYAPVETVMDMLIRPAEIVYGCGAFQAFHSSLLDRSIMDGEYWPAYFGDVDFCYRMRRAGHPMWYTPEVVVIHDAGAWTSKNTGVQVNEWYKNQTRFIQRWSDMVEDERKRCDESGAITLLEPSEAAREALEYAVGIMRGLPERPAGAAPVLCDGKMETADL